MVEPGRRERKKQATRAHIAGVATMLFLERGFEQVTVAQVAEAADVSKMTVFNHFPRKEDLFLDRHAERVEELERVLSERAPETSAVEALRRHHHELLAAGHPLSGAIEGVVGFAYVMRTSPALANRMLEQEHEIGGVLAAVLERETGDAVRARLVGALLAAASATIFHTAADRMLAGDPVEEVRRDQVGVIDAAFDLLAGGLDGPSAAQRA